MKQSKTGAFMAGQEAGRHWGWDEEAEPLRQLLEGRLWDAPERNQQWQRAWREGYRSVLPLRSYQLYLDKIVEGVWTGRTEEEAVERYCEWLQREAEYEASAGRNVKPEMEWIEAARAGRIRTRRITHLRGIVFSAPSGLVAALKNRFPGVDVAVYTAPAEWDICATWSARGSGGCGPSISELMTDIWRAESDARAAEPQGQGCFDIRS